MKRVVPEGVKVFVQHYRVPAGHPVFAHVDRGGGTTDPANYPGLLVRSGYFKDTPNARPAERGGLTEVVLYEGDRLETGTELARAIASCSLVDAFNKTLGRTIALGRALAELDGTAAKRDPSG